MANVKIPATGAGDATPTIATDTVAGVEFQKVKLIDGTVGQTTPIPGGANGLKVDPSSVTSPVSIAGTVAVSAASLPLPTGAATSALQAGGLPAALGAGGGLKVDGSGTALPVTANAGTNLNTSALALDATLSTQSAKLPASLGQKAMAASMAVVVASDQSAVPVSGTLTAVTTVTAVTAITNALPAGTNTIGAVTGAGSATASTAGTQVASSASSVTLLSSNAARKGMLFFNNSTSVAYVLFGTTASATAFSVYMAPNATYEMFGVNLYTGRVDAIWVTANGNMQVTEW